uniref:Ig-like domain-containing protein n=1 Tax=Pygocentrus nattereri TaxID=42514 RepID=A0AAR2K124_PYGNA
MNVIILVFVSGDVFSYEVTPLSAEVHVLEGRHDTATLSCNYSGTNILAYQWYKQYPNSAPEGFSQAFENTGHHDHERRITVQKELKRLDLEIFYPAKKDSALYYCALVTTVTGKPSTLYKNFLNLSSL